MTLKLKSIRERPEPADGLRMLITRFQPRYTKKKTKFGMQGIEI
jgi:uncharacterized protein YeaO (DUF488 family)